MTISHQFVFGIHAVETLLRKRPDRIKCLYVSRHDKRLESLRQLARTQGIAIECCTPEALNRLVSDGYHQGVVAYCAKQRIYHEEDLSDLLQQLTVPPLLLVLDGVQDPHNLGACLRSADAAGVHAIIAPKHQSVGLTPIVSKVASGAVETVPFVQVVNLTRTLQALQALGIWVYGAALEAKQVLYQTDLSGPIALVLGAEGRGLRRLTREHCDGFIHIPMQGTVTSLNVSVAAGIVLFEVVRQRYHP